MNPQNPILLASAIYFSIIVAQPKRLPPPLFLLVLSRHHLFIYLPIYLFYFMSFLALTPACMSSVEIEERSHISRNKPPGTSNSSSGGPNSAMLPASITQIL